MNLQCGCLRGARVAPDSQATVVKQAIFIDVADMFCVTSSTGSGLFSEVPESLTVTSGYTCCDVFFFSD